MSKENISEQIKLKDPDQILIKYNGRYTTFKNLLDELNDHNLLPDIISKSTEDEFSELFKQTDGKYMTEEDMKKKAKEYEEMAKKLESD